MRLVARFTVYGDAVPQGSKVKTRFGVREDAKGLDAWRGSVAQAAGGAAPAELAEGPVLLMLTFVQVRGSSHYRSDGIRLSATGRALRALLGPARKPDLGKLARAVEDALTGTVYRDDGQIVMAVNRKVWGAVRRTHVEVFELLHPDDVGTLYRPPVLPDELVAAQRWPG